MRIISWMRNNKTFVIAVLGVIIAFSGLTAGGIYSFLTSLIVPGPPDYTITSLDVPTKLDINLPLNVSQIYYVVTDVSVIANSIAVNEKLRFSVDFENRGKTRVQEPLLKLYFVDSIVQVRAIWAHSLSEEEIDHGCNFAYILPPSDQMVLGSWRLIALLYNNETAELVSYSVQDFYVVKSRQEETTILIFISTLAVFGVIMGLISTLRERAKKRKKFLRKAKKSQEKRGEIAGDISTFLGFG